MISPSLGRCVFFLLFLYGVLDSLDTQDLIFWTKNSGIKYILHTFATTFARSEFFRALELWEAKCLQNHFLAKLQALPFASFTSAVCVFEQRSFENIWNKLFSPCHYLPIFLKKTYVSCASFCFNQMYLLANLPPPQKKLGDFGGWIQS